MNEMTKLIHCYVINLLTDTKITFKVPPEELTESVSASFEPQEIRGRSAPFFSYNSNGARTVSFTVTLHEEYCAGGIWKTVNQLKALVYPTYSGSIVRPPKCYVRFGSMVGMRAIIENVSVSWEKPYIQDVGKRIVFNKASVSLEFTEYMVNDTHDAYSMEKEGGIRNLSRSSGITDGGLVASDRITGGGRIDTNR